MSVFLIIFLENNCIEMAKVSKLIETTFAKVIFFGFAIIKDHEEEIIIRVICTYMEFFLKKKVSAGTYIQSEVTNDEVILKTDLYAIVLRCHRVILLKAGMSRLMLK